MKSFRQIHGPIGLLAKLWIGGSYDNVAHQWKWRGSQGDFPIRTFDWAPGEPNNSAEECITLFPAGYGHGWDGWDYKWCDGGCGAQFNFICEK